MDNFWREQLNDNKYFLIAIRLAAIEAKDPKVIQSSLSSF